MREVCDDFNCVTSEALAVKPKSVEIGLQKSAAGLHVALKYNDDINGVEIGLEV